MEHCEIITARDSNSWNQHLARCGDHDTYHLAGYHLLAEALGEGQAYLFYYQNEHGCAALPYLLRDVARVDGLGALPFKDATSVYGYPGVVTAMSVISPDAASFRASFQRALVEALSSQQCITCFSRSNPLLDSTWLLEGAGAIEVLGTTVAIDLTQPDAIQTRGYSKGHRHDIHKARALGVHAVEDASLAHLDLFIDMYEETMHRTRASAYYHFPRQYYERLTRLLPDSVSLVLAFTAAGAPIAASLFLKTGPIVQYHLSGTSAACLEQGGAKVIIDEVRRLATTAGARWLHLGGGVGSGESTSLFRFKAGFSRCRLPFKVAQLIVSPQRYAEAVEARRQWMTTHKMTPLPGHFFPEYRRGFLDDHFIAPDRPTTG